MGIEPDQKSVIRQKDGTEFYYEYLSIRANHLENFLDVFFANNMRYKNMPSYQNPSWRIPKERTITAEAMKGLQVWNELGSDVVPFDRNTQARLKTLRMWLADTANIPPTPYNTVETATSFAMAMQSHLLSLKQVIVLGCGIITPRV